MAKATPVVITAVEEVPAAIIDHSIKDNTAVFLQNSGVFVIIDSFP